MGTDDISVLRKLYPENEIYVTNPQFASGEPSVVVDCTVHSGKGYTINSVPYVTAENYVRILSQTSYLLSFHLVQEDQVETDLAPAEFIRAMVEYELYYRNIAMTFHKRMARGEVFPMELILSNFREIKRLNHEFILFTFANRNTAVLSGEMSFVYVRKPDV